MQEQSKLRCNNCHATLQEGNEYCHACGQKNTTGKVTVRELLSDFVENNLHLNTKLPRTLFALFFRPGKLTKIYFEGKHQRYLRPIRLFGITTLLFIAVLAILLGQDEGENPYEIKHNEMIHADAQKELSQRIDSNLQVLNTINPQQNINFQIDTFIRPILDSLAHPEEDSLPIALFNIGQEGGILIVSSADLFTKAGDQIADEYNVETFWQRFALIQGVRGMKNPKQVLNYALKLIFWMFLFMIPFFAILLKLVYFRRKRYYVEHLVFTFHVHSFIFTISSLLILPIVLFNTAIRSNYQGLYSVISSIGFGSIIIYIFLAIKQFYQQSFGKTFLKYLLLTFGYSFMFVIFLLLFLMITIILF